MYSVMHCEANVDELARRARDGDLEALAELVRRERSQLFAVAYAELRHYDDAQDAVASALLRICRHVGELREPQHARAWMRTIVRNEARQSLRRSLPASRVVSPEQLSEEQQARLDPWSAALSKNLAPTTAPDATVLRLDLLRALRQLPWDEARVLILFYLACLPIREIAELMGHPEGTIKSWLHRGRRRLATELADYAPGQQVC
jgi:RNA polymerase sigma-70 factor (ECF subfamily)